jgi:hydrogenase expression/formation protein HypC
MCMAVPGKVVEVNKTTAKVEFFGKVRDADCSLVECKPGQYVFVNAGFVMEIVPERAAEESLRMWKDGMQA